MIHEILDPARAALERPARKYFLSIWAVVFVLSCTSCTKVRKPPPFHSFNNLPISGSLSDARRLLFNSCFNLDAISIRCRRHNISLLNFGPYEAAVDLTGSKGEGGFDELVIWSDTDQHAVLNVSEFLKNNGWDFCYRGERDRGDQLILTNEKVPARVMVDLSYYSKRRLRIIPNWNRDDGECGLVGQ